jgi:endonuclease III related protein
MKVAKLRRVVDRAVNRSSNRSRDDVQIRTFYRTLLAAWGPQHWWPAHTPFEVIVGSFLTQNTAWTNVERALANLRAANLLSLEAIRQVPLPELERLIRPSGYFRQKAQRLKTFVAFLDGRYASSLDNLFTQPTNLLREQLLGLNGIGPETADSILLYAGNHPVFVVDAYTRRILDRHEILPQKTRYEEIRQVFERSLAPVAKNKKEARTRPKPESESPSTAHQPSPMSTSPRSPTAQVYNEMHGLIVGVGKHYCKKAKPACDACPLKPFLPPGTPGQKVRNRDVSRSGR